MALRATFCCCLTLSLLIGKSTQQAEDENKKDEKECEEAWSYVEFMKAELSGRVEEILSELYDAKERGSPTYLEETVAGAMEGVMKVREKLLDRIKQLRKGDIEICEQQNIRQEKVLSGFRRDVMNILLKLVGEDDSPVNLLKTVSRDLLRFKTLVGQEIMRMLMLPQRSSSLPISDNGCVECDVIEELNFIMENLIACAAKEGDGTAEDSPSPDDDSKRKPGDKCMPPNMYSMDLITATDKIDGEIGNLYNKLITAIEEDMRQEYFQKLDFFKQLRSGVNDVITKLVTESDEEKLKKIIERSVNRISNELKSKLRECTQKCGSGGGGCISCAAEIIYDTIAKLNDFKAFFENSDNEAEKKDFVRNDMIRFINVNDEDARDILIDQAKAGNIDQCNEDKLEVFDKIKGPSWMLVNATIFSPMDEVEVMVTAMIGELEKLLDRYCGDVDSGKRREGDGPDCGWREYTQTKEYLEKVDDIIQNALFKAKEDADQITALLGFVDIQGMMDKRVKSLFEDQLQCPDEVDMLKKVFMVKLNRCMAEFMNKKLKFSAMSRSQRISCIKGLRDSMEQRMANLLQKEVEQNLNEIEGESQESGDGEEGGFYN